MELVLALAILFLAYIVDSRLTLLVNAILYPEETKSEHEKGGKF